MTPSHGSRDDDVPLLGNVWWPLANAQCGSAYFVGRIVRLVASLPTHTHTSDQQLFHCFKQRVWSRWPRRLSSRPARCIYGSSFLKLVTLTLLINCDNRKMGPRCSARHTTTPKHCTSPSSHSFTVPRLSWPGYVKVNYQMRKCSGKSPMLYHYTTTPRSNHVIFLNHVFCNFGPFAARRNKYLHRWMGIQCRIGKVS